MGIILIVLMLTFQDSIVILYAMLLECMQYDCE